MGVVKCLGEEQDFWKGKVMEPKWDLCLQTRRWRSFAEELARYRAGGGVVAAGFGSGLCCEADLLPCGVEEMAGMGKWPEFGWGVSVKIPEMGKCSQCCVGQFGISKHIVPIKLRDQSKKGLSG